MSWHQLINEIPRLLIRIILFSSLILNNDALFSQLDHYSFVNFYQSSPSSCKFNFLGKEYVIDLTPNQNVFHRDFRLKAKESSDFSLSDEFIGEVKEPISGGKAVLSRFGNGFVGVIYLQNDTLHLESAKIHFPDNPENQIIGYFGSAVHDLHFVLGGIEPFLPVSFPPENPFLAYRRRKRGVPSLENEKKNRCPLKIVADFYFFSKVGRHNAGITIKYLVNMVARVNEIYTRVNWDEDNEERITKRGRFMNMGFSIKEIKILERPNATSGHFNGPAASKSIGWTPEALLEAFTVAESSSDFCLVHLVTARTFPDSSVIGLAYIGSPTKGGTASNVGGICSAKQILHGRSVSYNTVFSSTVGTTGQSDYPLVTRAADIVVAHEYGHCLGAAHDPTSDSLRYTSDDYDEELAKKCSPTFRDGGNYIMSAFAQNGYDPNNVKFSPCSRRSILKVLESRWDQCFEEEKTSFCGNGVIEDGEECDNGRWLQTADEAACCDNQCRLAVGAVCSPRNHICCTSMCQYQNSTHVCLPGDSLHCKGDAMCSGISGDCPTAPPAADGDECVDEGECRAGACVPFCEKKSVGKKSCICQELNLSCKRCCRDNLGICRPEPGASDLRDGTWCVQGSCRNSKCENEVADYVRNYLNVLSDRGQISEFVRRNMVVFIVILVTILWIPLSCLVIKHDNRQRRIDRQSNKLLKRNVILQEMPEESY